MKWRATRVLGLATAAAAFAACLVAQEFVIQPPRVSLTLPNYSMTSIGQVGGLQGGAFVARANDASSNWYNPAGLALAEKAQISSSAGSYQILSLVPEDLTNDDTGGSSQQVPALVGVVIKNMFGDPRWTAGVSVVRTNSFEQETDARIDDLLGTSGRLLDYSADSSYRRTEAGVGLGYNLGARWRFGATLAAAMTSVRAVSSIFEERLQADDLDAGLASRRASGSVTQLRLEGGAQYQLTDSILLGATLRTPGVTLFRSAEYSFDTLATVGPATASLAFFDPKPRFDYKLPFQASIGAAWICDRFEIEADVNFSSGSSPYDMFSSDRTATLIFDDGGGGPPIVEQVPFGDIVSENRAIVDVALGGSWTFTKNRVWTAYFGFNTTFSPVGDDDQFFSRVDVYGLTGGISGTVQGFTAAIGVNYQFGDASNVPLADILESDISLSSVNIIYSIAYKF
jgi:long-subunit fatty acid transport protein